MANTYFRIPSKILVTAIVGGSKEKNRVIQITIGNSVAQLDTVEIVALITALEGGTNYHRK